MGPVTGDLSHPTASPETEAVDEAPEPQSTTQRAYVPAGRKELIRQLDLQVTPQPSRERVPPAAFVPFLVIIGPALWACLTIFGYLLGVVGAGAANYMWHTEMHWQVLGTAIAYLLGLDAVWRHRRQHRTDTWPSRVPLPVLIAGSVVIAAGSGAAALEMWNLKGGTDLGQYFQVGSVLLWCPLMLPVRSGIVARQPGRAHAPATRAAAMVSMEGLIASFGSAIFISVLFGVLASPALQSRQAKIDAWGNPGAPVPHSLLGMLAAIGNDTGNAILEECVFAVLVLVLERAGRRQGEIIAVAYLLRSVMHLYYGLHAFGTGVFGAFNAYALLRWRRIMPLIAVHALYDVIVASTSYVNWLPRNPLLTPFAFSFVCVALTILCVGADRLIRRVPRAEATE